MRPEAGRQTLMRPVDSVILLVLNVPELLQSLQTLLNNVLETVDKWHDFGNGANTALLPPSSSLPHSETCSEK
jgi:hypothetical protein